MRSKATPFPGLGAGVGALAGVAAITALSVRFGDTVGSATAALLYILPVLFASVRGSAAAGLMTALMATMAYNFFLLPPQFTFVVHGLDNIAALIAFLAVAVVSSRLAAGLRTREAEAHALARDREEQGELRALLSKSIDEAALDSSAEAFLAKALGDARLIPAASIATGAGLSPLDASAAAWALHNGDITGRGSAIMPGAAHSFVPLSRGGGGVIALSIENEGTAGPEAQANALARIWSEARDRLALNAARQAALRMEERDALRRSLLAALAHDFRTPLTLLRGQLAALPGVDTRPLIIDVDRITAMANDLLAAAQIESGELEPRIEPVDLVDIVAPIADALRRAHPSLEICVNLSPELPLIAADAVLLRHMVLNLTGNAARHAHGAVSIVGALLDDGGEGVALAVDDDGPGLAPGEAATIFDRFSKTGGSDASGGSGLGLSIVKGLGTAMGATVTAGESPLGGARFLLRLRRYERSSP